ncbi:hypothetical protein RRG08_057638 [Elysia crispata]|uniref:Uncharacterized protein n=1 Tax=Elysia crispata TaxID=231223 RepID=A0AAE1A1P2_9GAST|nr:hypothetical protein RRG08_057638 [Elysia crispata]
MNQQFQIVLVVVIESTNSVYVCALGHSGWTWCLGRSQFSPCALRLRASRSEISALKIKDGQALSSLTHTSFLNIPGLSSSTPVRGEESDNSLELIS